jgi:sec-independent protein translocase protein TatA
MLGGIGAQELLLILLVLLLLFGAKKIPEIAKGLGKSVSEFKKGMRDIEDEIKKEDLKKEGNNSEEKKKLAG